MILKRKPQLMGFRQGLAKLTRIRSAFRYLVKPGPPLANRWPGMPAWTRLRCRSAGRRSGSCRRAADRSQYLRQFSEAARPLRKAPAASSLPSCSVPTRLIVAPRDLSARSARIWIVARPAGVTSPFLLKVTLRLRRGHFPESLPSGLVPSAVKQFDLAARHGPKQISPP